MRIIQRGKAIVAFLTRNSRFSAAICCLLVLSGIACSKTALRGPRVVWVQGDRVYVASPDSVALQPGTLLTFKDRGKLVAAGEVIEVHNAELIAAKLTSGSLAKVKHLERLEVAAERLVLPSMSLLRVGYPAASRKSLLFECSYTSLDSSAERYSPLQGFYKSEEFDGRAYCLVRDSTAFVVAPWPDTLLVRLFEDVADEEIALERGDLDIAVFWPGEASTHIREIMGWKPSEGPSARGVLAATGRRAGLDLDTIALRDGERRAVELLNQKLFRGDLSPIPHETPPSVPLPHGRFEVDASIPGHEPIERFLNEAMRAGAASDSARIVRLSYSEIWPPFPHISGRYGYQLVVRCPVISPPKLRPYLDAINAGALANLFQCLPPAPKQ